MEAVEPLIVAGGSGRLASVRAKRFTAVMAEARSDLSTGVNAGLDHDRDLRLVATLRDRDAFRRLFDHYGPRVKAYLRRLGADDGEAEDLTQEVFVSVWRRAEQFDSAKASAATWIFTIARNKRIDALRRDRPSSGDTEELELEVDPAPFGDAVAELNQLSALVMRALETLPEDQKRLLKIFYFEDKSHSLIARELGLPLGTVKSRLRLALGKLRAMLGNGVT